ncbi:Glucosamine/galactosamine-6-phosphate isomerase [Cynara cardunculus var. scolymus]|uniref:Glucosamine/galactosamine-6-phosphate isomerase n=1 Tax=Cynara cardunculus var. scolymus TaxID=59895 RepID=A0A103XVR8_CYNCS|nr:Glucosamine/galactosamine-6-phosphate isomerase [Cynara cardunculus var. scolymus]
MAVVGSIKDRGEVRIHESLDELSRDLVDYIAELSEISIKERGVFAVALSGGSLISLISPARPSGVFLAILRSLGFRREEAANEYEFVIRQLVKTRVINVSAINDCPKFDLILLGIGPDGHVASLFPDHSMLEEKHEWVTFITDSPKPPLERITFTLPVINSAANVVMAAIGGGKAEAAHLAIDDVGSECPVLPARMVQPDVGKLMWFLDCQAASKLKRFC